MNRRGFLGFLAAAPVAAAAAVKIAQEQPRLIVAPAPRVAKSGSLQMATYKWGSFHDGFGDSRPADLEALLRENMECLKQGFEDNFDLMTVRP